MSTSQAYTEMAELAGGFIHDVKNHISTLGLHLQLLTEDFAEPQNLRERRALERVRKLQGECNRLVEVSNDFLRFAKATELQRAPTDLNGVVSEIVDFFTPTARAAEIRINWYPCGILPWLLLDRESFKQALLNLMLNAEQAMPQGGDLLLQVRVEEERVCLAIIDSGVGIPAEELDKVFRPFHTTKPGGTGLGLPTVKRIVEAHEGRIEVQSEVGCGTQFVISLPKLR